MPGSAAPLVAAGLKRKWPQEGLLGHSVRQTRPSSANGELGLTRTEQGQPLISELLEGPSSHTGGGGRSASSLASASLRANSPVTPCDSSGPVHMSANGGFLNKELTSASNPAVPGTEASADSDSDSSADFSTAENSTSAASDDVASPITVVHERIDGTAYNTVKGASHAPDLPRAVTKECTDGLSQTRMGFCFAIKAPSSQPDMTLTRTLISHTPALCEIVVEPC